MTNNQTSETIVHGDIESIQTSDTSLDYLAKEQYCCIIGPSKGSAILTLSPSLAPTKENASGKHSNFAPADAASFAEKHPTKQLFNEN